MKKVTGISRPIESNLILRTYNRGAEPDSPEKLKITKIRRKPLNQRQVKNYTTKIILNETELNPRPTLACITSKNF